MQQTLTKLIDFEKSNSLLKNFIHFCKMEELIVNILVLGSGGREHAIVWKLKQSPTVKKIFVAPGNGGTALEEVINVPIAVDDLASLVQFALKEKIDLVIPGPELPLTQGIVNLMHDAGINCFGPDKYCAQLEGSKSFAKGVMAKAKVPCAKGAHFSNHAAACDYVHQSGAPVVIKADGLAAGKGVVVAQTVEEAIAALDAIMIKKIYGSAGIAVVIEEFLEGEEISFLCFCDGKTAVALPSCQDHKAIFDGDKGPNTGGMGAYSPAPLLSQDEYAKIIDLVIVPILNVLGSTSHPFKGILYAGLMMTKDGPKVLEYNTRFGDPECQPLLMRLKTPLDQIMQACVDGKLHTLNIEYSDDVAVGVVLSAKGYPEEYPINIPISGIDKAESLGQVKVFHSGTKFECDRLLSNGGRVLCITALGSTLEQAQQKAYEAIEHIQMDNSYYRKDIASKGIKRLKG